MIPATENTFPITELPMIRDTSAQDRSRVPASSAPVQRWLLPAGAVLALGLAVLWLASGWRGGSQSFDASRLRIATVTRGDLVRDLSAEGRVATANAPTLYAIAAGTVRLEVVAGDAVQAGQTLAVIDSPELRSRLVQEEATLASLAGEARRAQLDARLAQSAARKLLDQARIDDIAAQRDLERSQSAFDRGAIPRNDLDRARDLVQKAQIGLAAAEQEFAMRQELAQVEAENKQLAAQRQDAVTSELRRQVEALTLRAPFDGQVGQVQVAQGSHAAVNAPILSVIDLSVFEVEIRVPESFARDLALGVPAQIRSAGSEYPATVAAVSPEVVNGEVTARLRFDEGAQPPGLRQNQRLNTRIVLDRRENVLQIARGPFLEQDGGQRAWVVEGGSAVRRPVRFGVAGLDAVEILSGLEAGDRVVVSGTDRFENADQVRITGE